MTSSPSATAAPRRAPPVRALLDARIAEIDATVADLLALRRTLTHTRQRADARTEDEPVTVCKLIEGA
ncbi:hypothetical protein [Streptomyces gossypiisoli]|uniref:hypothetical protein n=1 Tax=Streptomyces gossypiisoli TaxID=2748864 RepID=UPI001E3DC80D|nr:hypothetical protein [Streptomyces gossypiisoli]